LIELLPARYLRQIEHRLLNVYHSAAQRREKPRPETG
jgi:hypothetical protein